MRFLTRYMSLVLGCILLVTVAHLALTDSHNLYTNWILFKSERNDNYALYRMRMDGTQVEHLADLPSRAWQVHWIRGGEWVILQEHNSTTVHRLKFEDKTRENLQLDNPRLSFINIEHWSADGHAILFYWQYIGLLELKVSQAKLTTIHETVVDMPGINLHSVSPDNRSLLLENGNDILLYHFDDEPLPQIWQKNDLSGEFQWSSDSQWLAFGSNHETSLEIYRMRPDGSDLERLTTSDTPKYNPVWSADNQSIYFEQQDGNNRDIYRLALDDLSTQRLTVDEAIDRSPYETLDAQWIVFETIRDGNWEIYRMKPDGSSPQNLTNNPGNDQVIAPAPLTQLTWHLQTFALVAGVLMMSALISLRFMRFT